MSVTSMEVAQMVQLRGAEKNGWADVLNPICVPLIRHLQERGFVELADPLDMSEQDPVIFRARLSEKGSAVLETEEHQPIGETDA